MKFTRPKIIFFDAGNVLLYKKSAEGENIARELGFDPKEYERIVRGVINFMPKRLSKEFWRANTLEKEIANLNEFHRYMCKYLAIRPSSELIGKLTKYRTNGDYALRGGVLKMLKRLANNYRLGIITNALPSRRYHELKLSNLDSYFDTIIVSFEVGVQKPDLRIYKIAMKEAKVKPHEVLYIDDKEEYLEGAKRVGIKNLLLFSETPKPSQYRQFGSLNELLKILE